VCVRSPHRYSVALDVRQLHPVRPTVSRRLRGETCGARPASLNLLERAGASPLTGPQPTRVSII
jgi:hypothetical protein